MPSLLAGERGKLSDGVTATMQYGPNVQALAAYLYQAQLVRVACTCELLAELRDCPFSEAMLLSWVQQASETVKATVA